MAESPSIARRAERERIVTLMQSASGSTAQLVGVGLMSAYLAWKAVAIAWVLVWALSILAGLKARTSITNGFRMNPGFQTAERLRHLNIATFVLGSLWGISALLMKFGAPTLIPGDVAIATFILLSVCIYGINEYGAHLPTYLCFSAPILLQAEAVLLLQQTARANVGFAMLIVFAVFAVIGCRAMQQIVIRNLELRIRNDDLSHSLRDARGDAAELDSKLHSASYYDSVTGLPNRSFLLERLEHALTAPELSDVRHAVMHVNLDNFRRVNDSLGRDLGNELLRDVGNRLRSTLRSSDLLAHLGADEYAILVENVSSPTRSKQIADKLVEAMALPFLSTQEPLVIGATIGICFYPDDGASAGELIRHAETAMYHAKRELKQPIAFYTGDMQERVRERLEIEQRLRIALQDGELDVFYQPQHSVESRRLIGLEALLRWHHPKHGSLSPAIFVAIAEEAGLVPQLDQYVLESVFRQSADWNSRGIRPARISINLSALTLRDRDLLERIETLLLETAARPDWFDLELTESVFLERDDQLGLRLQTLREMGFRLSLDDFGTGYSSLGYLRRFPMDVLKIDRSFIMDVTTDPSDAAIVRAIIAMAHHLNLVPIAEGVENEEQLSFLSESGCDIAQGFLFSPAVTASDIDSALN